MIIQGVTFKIKNEDRQFVPKGVWCQVEGGYLVYVPTTQEPGEPLRLDLDTEVAYIKKENLEYIFYETIGICEEPELDSKDACRLENDR